MNSNFVHLHLHTQFSLLDGAIRFDRLFDLAREYGMGSCAITDHGNMYGAIDFYFSAKEYGIKPIIGCETYIAPKSRLDRERTKGEDNAFHIVLLAMNDIGYKNLLKLVSFAHLEGFYYVPRIDRELLRQYNEGLICLTACLKGEIPSLILRDDETRLKDKVEEYMSIFNDRLYFELQDNGLEEQKKINEGLIGLSRYYNVPIVATNDCHYLKREEARAQELLLCIQTGKTIHDKNRLSFKSDEFYFKSPDDMSRAFSMYPEALANTLKIADMCNVTIDTNTYHFPEFNPPRNIGLNDYFTELCETGISKRMTHIESSYVSFTNELKQTYRNRLSYELDVIKNTGFAGYFLIVSDFINYAKAEGIPVGPGRGSAAGSLVAYCLGITDIDPIKYDLTFERFLNPERVSMPDIDVDFCMDGREKVIHYVTDKYGKDNVAQIITFGTMQSKAAVRDAGRALGMPYSEVDKIAKLVTSGMNGIQRSIKEEPQLRELYEKDERIKELLDNAKVLEGLARHASTHAAGIVISNKHLSEYLPLCKGKNDETLTQYHMKVIEKIGLIKFDFLGLETLTIMENTVKLLKNQGIEIDMGNIPLDDNKTFELLSAGDTSGVFQLESSGMRDLLIKLKPSKFEDIMPLIALYRPGPLNSGMADEFCKRKNNPSLVKYGSPLLEEVLRDTYGVIIYQEQIMRIASVLSNFSMKDADALRKAISKKIPEQLESYKDKFLKGAVSNGVDIDTAKNIYDVILRFGEYGFNKAHSTAYGLIAYQTAHLKAHHYVPFFAAILTSAVNNTDNLIKYISELRENGIEVLPPDINKSDKPFTVVDNKIRFGLSGIKNVGNAAIDNIISVRETIGDFTSFHQFLDSIDSRKINKKVLESLAKAGCFDKLALKRSQILSIINERSDRPQKRDTKTTLQMSMFDMRQDNSHSFEIPDMDELSQDEIQKGEKESLGFYFNHHPLAAHAKIIRQITPYDTQNIKERDVHGELAIVGIVSNIKEITTKRGDKMAYLTIEDTKGTIDVIVFPDLFLKNQVAFKSEKPLIVTGTVEKNEEGPTRLIAKGITYLADTQREMNRTVKLIIFCERFNKEELKKLKDILVSIRGTSKVVLEFKLNGESRSMPLENIRVDHMKVDIISNHFKGRIDLEVLNEILS